MPNRFEPFCGWRYATDRVGALDGVVAPPYDVLSDDDRRALMAKSPYNIVRLDSRPKVEGENPYTAARDLLADWVGGGILVRDDRPSFTVLVQEFTVGGVVRRRRGIIGLLTLSPFSDGLVLPHERTHKGPKEDRFALMGSTRASYSQVFALYPDPERETARILDPITATPPHVSFADRDGIAHRAWRVDDPAACTAVTAMLASRQVFIADGHHRYETALIFRDTARAAGDTAFPALDKAMMYLVDMDQPGLAILPYHRLFTAIDMPEEGCLPPSFGIRHVPVGGDAASLNALVEDLPKQAVPSIVYWDGGPDARIISFLDAPRKSADPLGSLEVNLLHHRLLPHLLDDAAGVTITTTPFVEEAVRQIRSGNHRAAFLLPPTPLSVVRDVSLAGEVMPQKSTFFYPKIPTGLVTFRFDAC